MSAMWRPTLPLRSLVAATLGLVVVVGYLLVATHHLSLPRVHWAALHELGEQEPHTPVTWEAAQALAARLVSGGTFKAYDKDNNGQLDAGEFKRFVADMARSRLTDPHAVHDVLASSAAASESLPLKTLVPQPSPSLAASTSSSPSSPSSPSTSAAAPSPVAVLPPAAVPPPAAVLPPAASPPPLPASCPELTRDLVASFAVNGTIMLTVSDWRIFQSFGISWMKHLAGLRVEYFLVGATDHQTSAFLAGQGRHPCFKFFEVGHSQGEQPDYRYGDESYNAATWRKVTVVAQIVAWGFNVLHSDVDVVWLRDPLPYFTGPHLEGVDVAVSTDLVSTSAAAEDDGLEPNIHEHVNFNTGVYFVKSSPAGRKFMATWAALRSTLPRHLNDQTGLYQWVRDGRASKAGSPGQRFMNLRLDDGIGTRVAFGLLGVHMLLNGYTFFIPQLHKVLRVQPLGVHMTWVPLSREGKLHRMRDGGLYHDPPPYYTAPLLITADLELPIVPPDYNQWTDTERMIQTHLKAMDAQLVQVYRVMAVAVIMNRTLVLPKMHCLCYKNWFMLEQCRIPGDKVTSFPLDCTLDQWLRPRVMYGYGDNIIGSDGVRRSFQFREASMLGNKHFPPPLLSDQVLVQPGAVERVTTSMEQASALGPSLRGVPGRIKVVTLPYNLSQHRLATELQTHAAGAKIVRLRRALDLLGGWDDKQLGASFEEFLDKAAGNWCCRDRPFIEKGLREKEKLAIHW